MDGSWAVEASCTVGCSKALFLGGSDRIIEDTAGQFTQ